jgi:hypothetical protein
MARFVSATLAAVALGGAASMASAVLLDRGSDDFGNRLIYDTELNVTWYQPNNNGMNWGDAHAYAANLSIIFKGKVFDDWRLPRAADIRTGILSSSSCYIGWDHPSQANCLGELAHLYLELGGKSDPYDWSLAVNPRAYGDNNPFNTWPACPGNACLDAGYYWLEEGDDYELCGKAGWLIFWNTDHWGPSGASGGICQWQTNYKFAWALRDGDVVTNTPPTVGVGPHSGSEGAAITLNATAGDPDPDTLTFGWTYAPLSGVDFGATCSFSNPSSLASTITCTDDGTYTLTLTVNDGHNPAVVASSTLAIANANPTISVLSASSTDNTVAITAAFGDPGTNDTHACSVAWGDASASVGAMGPGTCSAAHGYAAPGTFTVRATVTDDDGGSGSTSTPVVITAQALERGLIGDLQAVGPSGNKGTDKRVDDAIKDLQQSLRADFWVDESHLANNGTKVFEEGRQAVDKLMQIKSPADTAAAAAAAIDSIVATDRWLAQTLRNDNAGGKAGELAKADDELAKGDAEAAAGRYDRAIQHYASAWGHARRAGL